MASQALKLREKAYRSFTRHLLARDIRQRHAVADEHISVTKEPNHARNLTSRSG